MAILINDTAPRNQYTATSGQTVFTVSFEFFENADLKVYKNNTLQTITTHYTVTGAGVTGGGSITLTSGATAGDIITIVRDIPVKRLTDFPTSGPFNISALNTELDKIIAMVQEREDDITRVVQLSDTDTSTSLTLPTAASRASKVLGFDATGNAIVMQELGNYRGNWAAGTAYVLRDIIKDTSNANIYICVQAHTSSGSQPISTNPSAASWALLVDAATATSSASAASSSASAAASSASSASISAGAASVHASNASTSATNASNSASSASTSATNAANSASAASTSATNAANSATSAATSASTATTQASNAASSASSAATSASTATTQASNASTSASNAASSASAAATSASNAATSATNASNSASAASTSASNAAAAQSAAESARDATLAAYDNFDDRYLGAKTSNPVLDNDGNALVAGALYFNSVAGEMRLWTGSAWVAAYVSGSGFLSTSGGTITGDLIVNASGSTNGIRITQTGTGNALVVEDSANPDATPFVVNASGNVGIGTTSPDATLTVNTIASFGAGSAALPSIAAKGDLDTGIWFPAVNTIAFSTDGTEDFRIGSAGQLGVQGANYGTSGQVLTSGGAAAAPSWTTVAASKAVTTQTFNSSGTWTKPSGYGASARVQIQAWGGGGAGGRYNTNNAPGGGGGGGGYSERWVALSSLGATETITIGAGGTAPAGNGVGGVGGTTSVGSILSAYGGGGGSSNNQLSGGGGGGQISAGATGANAPTAPGRPWVAFGAGLCGYQLVSSMSTGGSTNTPAGGDGFWGGGGGGCGTNGSASGAFGGSSYLGGGGGGAGGTITAGGAGGSGIAGGGNGGTGGFGGGSATAGAQPGGGGGGAYTGLAAAGGAGRVIITVFDGV